MEGVGLWVPSDLEDAMAVKSQDLPLVSCSWCGVYPRENLVERHIPVDDACIRCQVSTEYTEHHFLHRAPFFTAVWETAIWVIDTLSSQLSDLWRKGQINKRSLESWDITVSTTTEFRPCPAHYSSSYTCFCLDKDSREQERASLRTVVSMRTGPCSYLRTIPSLCVCSRTEALAYCSHRPSVFCWECLAVMSICFSSTMLSVLVFVMFHYRLFHETGWIFPTFYSKKLFAY